MASERTRRVYLCLLLVFLVNADVPSEGAGTGMSNQEQMAWLANAVYKFRTPIAGWSVTENLQLASAWTGETDNFALYQHIAGKRCALAIAGTNSGSDMFDNFDGRTVKVCGFPDIHAGYYNEVVDFLNTCGFQKRILPILQSDSCSGGISIVGHSLGGGVASVFAACANTMSKPYNFTVDELWTFGAPGVSITPLVNQQSSSQSAPEGCFNGGRFWNEDSVYVDPIPGLSRALFFQHPYVPATRVKDECWKETGGTCVTSACYASRGDAECSTLFTCDCKVGSCAVDGACVQDPKGGIEIYEFACNSNAATKKPYVTAGIQQPLLHLMSAYIGRCRHYWTGSSFSSPLLDDTAIASPTLADAGCNLITNYTRVVADYASQKFSSRVGVGKPNAASQAAKRPSSPILRTVGTCLSFVGLFVF